jgi:hypothetical protein
MSMGYLSTFCSLRSPSSIDYSFPNVIARYLTFFEAIVNGIVFLYPFSICSLLVYRKVTDFCKLILYSAILLKLLMVG